MEKITLIILLGLFIGLLPTIMWLILRFGFKVDIKQPHKSSLLLPILLAGIFAFKDANSGTKGGDE